MIRQLHIEDLKAFARPREIQLAPITLVFGENSAGKSSLLQALLLLKQTLDSSEDGALWTAGELVDLGGYANLVHRHDPSRSLKLGLTTSEETASSATARARHTTSFVFGAGDEGLARIRRVELGWAHEKHAVNLRAELRPDATTRAGRPAFAMPADDWPPRALVDWLQAVLGPRLHAPPVWQDCREAAVLALARPTSERSVEAWNGIEPDEVGDALSFLSGRMRPGQPSEFAAGHWLPRYLDPPASITPVADGSGVAAVAAAVDTILGQTTERLLTHLRGITHLGPARDIPERVFPLRPHGMQRGHGRGREAARLVVDPGLLASVNEHFRRLEVPYELDAVRLGGDDPLLENSGALRLLDSRYPGNLQVNIADVGFGISQLLPIVVAAVASTGGTVIMEQPELHVHPRLQARLGDVLVEEAPGTQFIVETHSEHLMLRLLSHVRAGSLDPTHLSVLYVDHDEAGEGAGVHRLEVDEFGEFVQRWPRGFFTEREEELLDQGNGEAAAKPSAREVYR
jgi:hypothetical protein